MRYLRFISHIHKSLPQNPSPNFFHTTQNPNPNLLAPIQSKLPSFKSSSAQPPAPSEQVSAIVDDLSGLTLLEVSDLVEVLHDRLGITEMPPTMMVMMPGMVPGGLKGKGGGAAKKVEEKAEKTVLDVRLEGFDAAAKIKVIKEVRTSTDLGLKEAKDLVEKSPTLLKKGVTKEEAESIIAKMKEVGAKVSME
ncbi:uncharacterized protein LOC126691778 [Quercus robur]|uniref:uncharacterized protein LOC126691778 n=1 Tax=Quercus robur TaxID=38942 RepID=UPI002162F1FB|nr:uncharacterized protein LOC126691778 [Quercus robur]XP_050242897.1 uncharacterized protein LOC126691778 [Quercus robur]XP_050242898.1 uncharacterized protein LOC126691778 [Quercus robur]